MRVTGKKTARCIVLSTDFQRPARRAFTYAVKLARVLGARMKIIHVIKTASDSSQVAPASRYLNAVQTSALLELGRMTRTAEDAGIPAEPLLLYGNPTQCILESAAGSHAELIVMGTLGRTGWDRMRFGSVAQGVIWNAPCPVLTIQDVVAGDAYRQHARVNLGRLLMATDFTPCANTVLRYVSGLAAQLKARVCIVHAADTGTAKNIRQRKLNLFTRKLQQKGLEAESLCVPGDPVEIILGQAAQWQADVIVVGLQGRTGLSQLVFGSVTEKVLRRAGCPVLVVGRP